VKDDKESMKRLMIRMALMKWQLAIYRVAARKEDGEELVQQMLRAEMKKHEERLREKEEELQGEKEKREIIESEIAKFETVAKED